jgi:hypothetical protein
MGDGLPASDLCCTLSFRLLWARVGKFSMVRTIDVSTRGGAAKSINCVHGSRDRKLALILVELKQ